MASQTVGLLLIMAVLMCSIAGAQEASIAAVTTGEVLILDCVVEDQSGDLDHEVVWFLDDVQVSNASRLILRDLNHTHHGSNITCYNQTDIIHTRIIHYHHKLIIEVGKTLTLNCTADPTADTNVTWHHTNKTAGANWTITDLDNVTSQLRIPNVTRDDIGLYSCRILGGDTVKAFNVSVGLFPQPPSSIDCFGCNKYHFTCEWQNIPDTHLPTEVTYESKIVWRFGTWDECPQYLNHGCYFEYGEHSEFRLNITNPLGRISLDVPEYDPEVHLMVPAPVITDIEALSSYQVDIHWTISECDIKIYNLKFKLEYTDMHTGSCNESIQGYGTEARLEKLNANTEYCFRVTGRYYGAYGQWSERVCTRTLPTVPNVKFDQIQYKDLENEKDEGLRDIDLSWKLVQINSSEPFQGISHFRLDVRLNEASTDEVDGNPLSPNDRNFTYDLMGRNDYRLEQDTFNYTIPGLSKYKNYTITLSAVNPADSRSTTLKIHAQVPMKKAGFVVIAAVVVPLVILLILALLAFGFQRLKNNSKPIPEPVYHGHTGNVKPTHIEPEVFDELPAVAKEKERQMLVNLSRESAKSQQEDKGCRTSSSSTSSGVGSDTPSLEMGVVEKIPLLRTQDVSGSMNKSPYSLLSELTPTLPRLQMAADAMETDLDSMSPTGGHYSSTDEGISLGGSSFYNHLGSFKDSSQPNPYYSMCGQVAGRLLEPPNDGGYMPGGSQQSSNVGCDYSLLRASDADDEASLPSSPATPMNAYYSYLSTPTDATSRDASPGYCEPYVITAGMPGSPPMRAPSHNLTTITESPNHYKPHTPSCDHSVPQLPCGSGYVDKTAVCDSGYVDNTAICIGIAQTGVPEDISNPSSTQSSPEHAVIIHKNPRRNQDSSDEYMDNTYFTSPPSTPLNNRSLPVYAANNTLSPSGASGYSCAPQNSACFDSPSKSNLQSRGPKDNAGYVTCEQVRQVQIPQAVAESREEPLQNPAQIGRGLPTLSGNAGGYVPVSQMSMLTQRDHIPSDTAAQTQASLTGRGATDLDTKMIQSVPAADLRREPSVDLHEPDSHSGYQLHERIPATDVESIPEPSLSSESQNAGHEVCSDSVASNVGPSRTGALPMSTDGGYVDKDMTNFPSRSEESQPLELNNNGYVRIP